MLGLPLFAFVLYKKTIWFFFPFLNKDRIQLKLNIVDLNSFPSSKGKYGIVEKRVSVGMNIKMPGMNS